MAKLKDLVTENFSVVGGVVSTPAIGRGTNTGLTDIVEDIYGTSEKVSARDIKEAMNNFSRLGKLLHREENLKEIASNLSEIANKAKSYTLSETEDWFDKVTVNRNMKELTTLSKSFGKFAQEAQGLQERMSALYEDMGHIVGRYYEIDGVDDEEHEPGHEEGGSIEEGDYEEFFQQAMDKFGISSPDELDDEKKKEFFNYVDANFKGKSEGVKVNEGMWAVKFELTDESDGTVVLDAGSKGAAITMVAKKLKKGRNGIKSAIRVMPNIGKKVTEL
jgi:hypothetical protein|tara:strand:- start:1247 stop:2074 length:828 start_codon:yes stop_codon:yes gene_type:complete